MNIKPWPKLLDHYTLTSNELLVETSGKDNFKKSMIAYYAARKIKSISTIESYTIDGSRISFKEVIRRKNKKGITIKSSAMGIYEMRNNFIVRAWYFID